MREVIRYISSRTIDQADTLLSISESIIKLV